MPKEFLIRGSKSSEEKHHITIRGILLLEHVSLFDKSKPAVDQCIFCNIKPELLIHCPLSHQTPSDMERNGGMIK